MSTPPSDAASKIPARDSALADAFVAKVLPEGASVASVRIPGAKLAGIAAGIGALVGTPLGAAAVFIAKAMAKQPTTP